MKLFAAAAIVLLSLVSSLSYAEQTPRRCVKTSVIQ
jgi:hypothetical protein